MLLIDRQKLQSKTDYVNRKSYAHYGMVIYQMTLTDPNPVFKVTAFLKSNIVKMACLKGKVTIEQ